MLPRRGGRNAQKRDGDDHPWTNINNQMATTSSYSSKPTGDGDDDNDDHSQVGPPSAPPIPWTVPAGFKPLFVTSSPTPSTLVTSTKPVSNTPEMYTATVMASGSVAPYQTTVIPTYFPSDEGGPSAQTGEQEERSDAAPKYAAAGAVPVIVLALIGVIVGFCMRKRRKQRRLAAMQGQEGPEMKSQQPTVHAYRAPTIPTSRAPSYTAPSRDMRRPMSPPPVILGPISAGRNYMTGIDTSDVVSTRNERTGLGDPFADGNSLLEEPPPPYKPRSLASRNSSIRTHRPSASVSSQYSRSSSQRHSARPLQNPFEDTFEEDRLSDLSGPTLNRHSDNISIVSDLSYQRDPREGRPSGG